MLNMLLLTFIVNVMYCEVYCSESFGGCLLQIQIQICVLQMFLNLQSLQQPDLINGTLIIPDILGFRRLPNRVLKLCRTTRNFKFLSVLL